MTYQILTEIAASISEFKANPMKVMASGNGMPIAILNNDAPAFYCVPAATYEAMIELFDDIELEKIAKERQSEESKRISIDDL